MAEKNERDPPQSVKPISQAVLAAVDLLRDGLGVALAGPAVQLACVPVEQRHRPSHGSALTASGSLTKSG